MKRIGIAALFTALLIQADARPADACGVKLTIKTQGPRKATTSANKSSILLIGSQSGRLKRELSAAGHTVDTASSPSSASKKQYAVVVVDQQQGDAAREAFPNSTVVVTSGDAAADVRTVENQVARKPVRRDQGRTVVAARVNRAPIAAGPAPAEPRRVVATKEPEATPTPAPTPPPAAVAPAPTPAPAIEPTRTARVEAKASDTVETKQPEPKAVKPAPVVTFGDEVHFTRGGYMLSARAKAILAKDAKWLADNTSSKISIEGHADPTGNADANMALSQKRAEAVRDYLVTKGVDASRLEVNGFGDTQLKYDSTDARNRRVMLVRKD